MKKMLIACFCLLVGATLNGCSDSSEPTYYVTSRSITSTQSCNELSQNPITSDDDISGKGKTFQEVKNRWLEISNMSGYISATGTMTESEISDNLAEVVGWSPSQRKAFIEELNNRGNSLVGVLVSGSDRCAIVVYYERE